MRQLDTDRTNGYAENARLKKADKLATAIADNYGPVTNELLEALFVQSSEWWASVAKFAKVNPPSAASIQATIGMLSQQMPVEVSR